MDIICSSAINELFKLAPDKPAIVAETGAVEAGHSRPSKFYPADRDGVLLHDGIFAPFFSGSAGCGQFWHWDYIYIDHNDLWYHFNRFRKTVEGIDPIAENYTPRRLENKDFRFYLLRGKTHDLLWMRDKANNMNNEFVKKIAPGNYTDYSLNLRDFSGSKIAKVDYYDPWKDEKGTIDINDGKLILPDFKRSLVLKLVKQ